MCVRTVVGVLPGEKRGIAFLALGEVAQHPLNLCIGKIESRIDVTVENVRRLELLNQAQTFFVTDTFS